MNADYTNDLETVMRTSFSARSFTDTPVTDEAIARILDRARFAPSGGNRQSWRVLVVRDDAVRAKLIDLASPVMRAYAAQSAAGEVPFNVVNPSSLDLEAAAADTSIEPVAVTAMAEAPVILMIFTDLSDVVAFDKDLDRIALAPGGSVFPFVWNILLGARLEGLAGVLTTYLHSAEAEIQDMLGVPKHVAFAASIPIGEPTTWLTKLTRRPVEEFARYETWDGTPVTSPSVQG